MRITRALRLRRGLRSASRLRAGNRLGMLGGNAGWRKQFAAGPTSGSRMRSAYDRVGMPRFVASVYRLLLLWRDDGVHLRTLFLADLANFVCPLLRC